MVTQRREEAKEKAVNDTVFVDVEVEERRGDGGEPPGFQADEH